MEDPPLLEPSWFGNGCEDCVEFTSGYPWGGGAYVNVSHRQSMGDWEEQVVLQASDRRSGDRFGSTLELDQVRAGSYLLYKSRNMISLDVMIHYLVSVR